MGQCCRRWPKIDPSLGYCIVFAGFLRPGGGGDSSYSASPDIGNAEAADILNTWQG